jgi:hypothetical protein
MNETDRGLRHGMSIFAGNRHPDGRGGKMLEETVPRVLLFCASVPKIIFAALYYGRVFHHPIILVPVRVH